MFPVEFPLINVAKKGGKGYLCARYIILHTCEPKVVISRCDPSAPCWNDAIKMRRQSIPAMGEFGSEPLTCLFCVTDMAMLGLAGGGW